MNIQRHKYEICFPLEKEECAICLETLEGEVLGHKIPDKNIWLEFKNKCLDMFSCRERPKVWHKVHASCLSEWIEHEGNDHSIDCPQCKESIYVDESCAERLTKNAVIKLGPIRSRIFDYFSWFEIKSPLPRVRSLNFDDDTVDYRMRENERYNYFIAF